LTFKPGWDIRVSMIYHRAKRKVFTEKHKTFPNLNEYLAALPKIPMESKDYKFLSIAEQWSRMAAPGNHRVGCVITQKNEIIGSGYNMIKTHPFQAKWNQYSSCLHAEMSALLECLKVQDFQPDKATVYVSRYTRRSGMLGCSYPCRHCWPALQHVGIKKIVCYDENDRPTKLIAG
jgi:deoxycytidylate deaminase